MRTSVEIKLTAQEDRELRLLVRRQKAPYAKVVRARMILLLTKGKSFSQVAREVGRARRIVHMWVKRFMQRRIAGLEDLPRSGRPARFSPDRGDVFDKAGLRTARGGRAVAVAVDMR